MKNQKVLLRFIGLAILVTAFWYRSAQVAEYASGHYCLEPEYEFAYPGSSWGLPERAYFNVRMAPNWERIIRLTDNNMSEHTSEIVVDGNDVMWLLDDGRLYTFMLGNEELEEVEVKNIGGYRIVEVEWVFLDLDKAVWVIVKADYGHFLAQYDYAENQFDVIEDGNGSALDIRGYAASPVWDREGNLWALTSPDNQFRDTTLVKITIENFKVHEILHGYDNKKISHGPYIDSEGFIWFGIKKESNSNFMTMVRYSHETDWRFYTEFSFHDRFPLPANVFFDHDGTLWYGTEAYIEKNEIKRYVRDKDILDGAASPNWQVLFPSPIFLNAKVPEGFNVDWVGGDIKFESSNRYLWYEHGAGIIRLDTQAESWCLTTNLYGPIAQDSQGNVWLAANSALYRYQKP